MLTLILIVALIVLMISVIVAAIRRHDANNYFDQDRDPFYAEPARLAAAGLLYEQKDKDGRPQKTYTVTPAGEAALRAWLGEPTKDPGLLKLYFAGMVAPADVVDLARSRRHTHVARLSDYERLETLLANRPEWRYALAAVRLGARFERSCLDFWDRELESETVDLPVRPTSREGEDRIDLTTTEAGVARASETQGDGAEDEGPEDEGAEDEGAEHADASTTRG